MKKFLADNIVWLVLIALVLAGFAVYKIMKSDGTIKINKKNSTDTADAGDQE